MYPFVRLAKEFFKFRNAPLAPWDVHISHHRVWPWDLDFMMELNNGRTLSIFDLGRIPFALRTGLLAALRRRQWGLTIAGSVVRYRRRLTAFERVRMQSRLLGWDDRFIYLEQSMWVKDGSCANHGIFRAAIVGNRKMVPTAEIQREMGFNDLTRPLPDWVAALFAADDSRTWPPELL